MVLAGGKEGDQEAFDQRRPWKFIEHLSFRSFPSASVCYFQSYWVAIQNNSWARPCEILRRVTSQIVDEGVNTLVSLLAIEYAFLYFLVSQGVFFSKVILMQREFGHHENAFCIL